MIPREILKKIRQIELRTTGLVKPSTTVFQLPWFAARMEHGQNHDSVFFNEKVNHKRKAAENHGASNIASCLGKLLRVDGDALQLFPDDSTKLLAQTRPFTVIPSNRIFKLLFCGSSQDEATFHFLYLASSRALTSSHATTSPGFLKWSARRRSISSASPGVSTADAALNSGDSPGPRSSNRACAISRRSSGCNSRALAKISVAFMESSLPETRTAGKFAATMKSPP